MKTYKVKKTFYQFYYADVEANTYDEAMAKANQLEIDDCTQDEYVEWEIYSVDEATK